jgi:hypothetical protein
MTPFRAIYEGIESFISGPGARLFGFLDGVLGISRIGSAAAGLAGAIGKILWPIGIIMSIFDGVSAYQNEEGNQYDRITAGISATIGDFLGAPLDLLKSLAAWVIGKFGFDETADAIREFSFEETIGNLLNGIFDFVGASVEWVKTLFTDPTEALSQLWTGLVGENGLFGIISDWLVGFYTWFTDLLPDVRELASRLRQQLIELLPERVRNLIGLDDVPMPGIPPAEQLGMATGNSLAVPRAGIDSLLPPMSQIGSSLRTSEVVDGVRERNAPAVIPIPVPQPAAAPASSGNGNGGGAFLLPAAPTIDILDAVPSYDARMYQGL